jgi:hypothetical protein
MDSEFDDVSYVDDDGAAYARVCSLNPMDLCLRGLRGFLSQNPLVLPSQLHLNLLGRADLNLTLSSLEELNLFERDPLFWSPFLLE